jgi:hypothetical protein
VGKVGKANHDGDVGGIQTQAGGAVAMGQHQADKAQGDGLARPRLAQDHQPPRPGQGVADPLLQATFLLSQPLSFAHSQQLFVGAAALLLVSQAEQS